MTRASRHRGVYVIGDHQIARALRLPAGQHVMAIATDFERMAILVQVEGEDLPPVAEGHQARTVNPDWWLRPPSPAMLAQLPPAERHAAVLLAVEGTALEDAAALQGRLRILRRHAPERANNDDLICSRCLIDHGYPDPAEWPCEDYLDAAGGVLTEPDETGDPR